MTLMPSDHRELDRYFQLGHFEKSPSGPMWERAFMFSGTPEGDYPAVDEADITAWPTSEQRVPAKGEPSSADTELIGRVSKKLALVRPVYRRALEFFHGDRGAAAALKVKGHGRIASLFELTPAGRALAKRERLAQGRGKRKTEDRALIQKALERQEGLSDDEAAATITLALTQSLDLKQRAEEAYTEATRTLEELRSPITPPRPVLRLVERDEDL